MSEFLSQPLLCCSQKYVEQAYGRQRSGELGSRCHAVRGSACGHEPGRFSSARPAPTPKGVTAQYTWPGSFRTSRDNRERLPPWPQHKLTKGIMCGGRSTQSSGDSVNVWLCYHAEVSVYALFVHGRGCGAAGGSRLLLTAVSFTRVCLARLKPASRRRQNR